MSERGGGCLVADGYHYQFVEMYWVSMNSSIRSWVALTPETRLLNAVRRARLIRNEPAIKANHSILQPLRNVEAALQITSEDRGDQTIFRVVCPSDHILLDVKGLNGSYRSKDFLAHTVSVPGTLKRTVGG